MVMRSSKELTFEFKACIKCVGLLRTSETCGNDLEVKKLAEASKPEKKHVTSKVAARPTFILRKKDCA
jgi:hypothetical protein